MFTVVVRQERLRPFCRNLKLSYEEKCGIRYAVLAIKNKRKMNWSRIRAMLGKAAGKVIFEQGIVPPPGSGIVPLDSSRYSQRLMYNGLSRMLSFHKEEALQKTAVLVDLNCRYQSFANLLVHYFKMVRIITRDCEVYRYYIDQKLYECGAAVTVAAPGGPIGDSISLFVSPNGVILPSMKRSPVPIVVSEHSGDDSDAASRIFCSFRAAMPNFYRELCRSGVDGHLLQAALFECCGIPEFSAIMPDRLFACGEWRTLSPAVPLFFLDNI